MVSSIWPECGREPVEPSPGPREPEPRLLDAYAESIRALWNGIQQTSTRLLPERSLLLLPPARPMVGPMAGLVHFAWRIEPARPLPFRPPAAPEPYAPLCWVAQPDFPASMHQPRVLRIPSSPRARPKLTLLLPSWVIIALAAVVICMAILEIAQQPVPASHAMQAMATAAAPLPPVDQSYPFARFVEVTGIRVIVDLNHGSQLQYLVVNHSATELVNIGLTLAVRSSQASPGSAPLFIVSARVPSLGAYQSKELHSELEAPLRSLVIPDWDNLRPDVQVTLQP